VVEWLGVVECCVDAVWLGALEWLGAELCDGALACGAGALECDGAELGLCCAQTNAGTSIIINKSDLLANPVFIFHLIADTPQIFTDHKHRTPARRFRRALNLVYFKTSLCSTAGEEPRHTIRTIDCWKPRRTNVIKTSPSVQSFSGVSSASVCGKHPY